MKKKDNKIIKAVGLDFDKEKKKNPFVVAKGKRLIAESLIKKAKEIDIPIHEDPDLVELLMELDIEDEIQPVLYKTVIEIFTFIYENCK